VYDCIRNRRFGREQKNVRGFDLALHGNFKERLDFELRLSLKLAQKFRDSPFQHQYWNASDFDLVVQWVLESTVGRDFELAAEIFVIAQNGDSQVVTRPKC
jgi:hypothetical protein